jgi:hypothetical protein
MITPQLSATAGLRCELVDLMVAVDGDTHGEILEMVESVGRRRARSVQQGSRE